MPLRRLISAARIASSRACRPVPCALARRPSASTVPASSRSVSGGAPFPLGNAGRWRPVTYSAKASRPRHDQGVEPAVPELAVLLDAIRNQVLLFGTARDGDAIRRRRQGTAAQQGQQIVLNNSGRNTVHDGMVQYKPEQSLVPFVDRN